MYLERAWQIVDQNLYGTLATVTADGLPWVSPVRVVHDDQLRFYWFSDRMNQHSVNVRYLPRAAMVLFDSTVPEGQGRGLYLAGQVQELSDPQLISLARTIKKGEAGDPNDFLGPAVRRVYQLQPERIWTNDVEIRDGRFIRDFRVELRLADLL